MTISEAVAASCRLDPDHDWNEELIEGAHWFFFHASWSQQDWLRDFACWTTDWLCHRVHWGYVQEFNDMIEAGLSTQLHKALEGSLPIVLCGYSRGAALAVMAHYWLGRTSSRKRIVSIAIGCPRLGPHGDLTPSAAVTYGNDAVTHLPPWWPATGAPVMQRHAPSAPGFVAACHDHGQYLSWHDDLVVPYA